MRTFAHRSSYYSQSHIPLLCLISQLRSSTFEIDIWLTWKLISRIDLSCPADSIYRTLYVGKRCSLWETNDINDTDFRNNKNSSLHVPVSSSLSPRYKFKIKNYKQVMINDKESFVESSLAYRFIIFDISIV